MPWLTHGLGEEAVRQVLADVVRRELDEVDVKLAIDEPLRVVA